MSVRAASNAWIFCAINIESMNYSIEEEQGKRKNNQLTDFVSLTAL